MNGRQSVVDFLSQIPLDRVIEVHLAGGMEMNGFWLDAHSGAIHAQLIALCREIFPQLPNVKAIIFEIFPSFIPTVGLELIKDQIEAIRELWELRPGKNQIVNDSVQKVLPLNQQPTKTSRDALSVTDWEGIIGRMVTNQELSVENDLIKELRDDPGICLAYIL